MPAVENIAKGLRPSKRMPRNSGFLTTCDGAVGRDGVLQIMDELTRLATGTMTFPFPQIFAFSKMTIVCSQTVIYEWVSGALVSKLTVSPGLTWRAVEFGEFVYMSNGVVAVERDPDTKAYALSSRPTASAICNYNGQVFIGASGITTISVGITLGSGSYALTGTAVTFGLVTPRTAKSIILDIATNQGHATHMGLRSIDFLLAGSVVDVLHDEITCYGDEYSSSYQVDFAFQTVRTKTGGSASHSWLNESIIDTRIICVFDSSISFDGITINNFHASGATTTAGLNAVKITSSTDAITDTTYNAAVSNSTVLYNSTFDEHTAVDEADPQALTLA